MWLNKKTRTVTMEVRCADRMSTASKTLSASGTACATADSSGAGLAANANILVRTYYSL